MLVIINNEYKQNACVAHVKASALRLYQVCAGSESADRSCAVARCLVLKRPELSDAGAEPWAQTRNETAGENLQDDAVQIRLILLGLRILVFYPLAFVAAEET